MRIKQPLRDCRIVVKHIPYCCLRAAVLFLFYIPVTAAYIGPGAGISFFGSLLTTLLMLLLVLFTVLFWPMRYLWRRWHKPKIAAQDAGLPQQPQAHNEQDQSKS